MRACQRVAARPPGCPGWAAPLPPRTPVENDAEAGYGLRTLKLELPAGTPIKPDWPDKVYGGRNTRLLARVLRSRTVQWQMAPINEIAPNLTKGRLDETLAAQ